MYISSFLFVCDLQVWVVVVVVLVVIVVVVVVLLAVTTCMIVQSWRTRDCHEWHQHSGNEKKI